MKESIAKNTRIRVFDNLSGNEVNTDVNDFLKELGKKRCKILDIQDQIAYKGLYLYHYVMVVYAIPDGGKDE